MSKEKIKVLFIDSRYHSFYGAQQSMFTLISNLDKSKYDPILLVTQEGELSKRARAQGINVEMIPLSKEINVFGKKIRNYSIMKMVKVIFGILRYNLKISKWIKENKFDYVYTNDIRSLVYIGLGAKLKKVPILWYVRSDHRIRALFNYGVRIADRVITIAEGVKNAFKTNELERFQNKFVTLYTGFNFKTPESYNHNTNHIKEKLNLPTEGKVIGLVGSISPRKGHDMLVEAAPVILKSNPNVHFVFVGDVATGYHDFKNDIEKKIRNMNLNNNFHWTGFVNDVQNYLVMMDLLILPSRSEGLPRTVIEGLSTGIPVIASDVGGVKEIIINNDMGAIFPKNDTEQMTKKIISYINDESRFTSSMKHIRIEYVKNKFSIDAYVLGFSEILRNIKKSDV